MLLAGDIGGTKTHLALFDEKQEGKICKEQKYVSKDYANLEEIIKDFVSGISTPIQKACFGIAGPIKNNCCHATNLAWVVDGNAISQNVRIGRVFLINDLEANAWGIFALKKEELFCIQQGVLPREGNACLIAAGTGLGEAGLYWDGKRYHPFACEGGHCDFAPTSDEEIALLSYLMKKFTHISYERVLSGPGLHSIYDFIIDTGREKESPDVVAAMQRQDPSQVITQMALQEKCRACRKAVDMFISLYGREASNLALKLLSVGGVYIGGGIAPKMKGELIKGRFLESFLAKGRFHKLLSEIPIYLIINENTALLGARYYAKEQA